MCIRDSLQVGKRNIEISYGDRHVIDVVRKHQIRLPLDADLDRRRGAFGLLDEVDAEAERGADGEAVLIPEVPSHGSRQLAGDRETEPDTLLESGVSLGELFKVFEDAFAVSFGCLLYTSPSP